MHFTYQNSDDTLLQEIGRRIADARLARNMTQAELAERAGMGVRTVQRLELGAAATHLSGFLRVCRVLGFLERLDALIPAEQVSPIALLKLKRSARQRASRVREGSEPKASWTWGE